MNFRTILWAALAAAPLAVGRASAEAEASAGAAQTQVVVAGPRYAAGPLHRFLLGSDYRRTWTTPVRVPVLDLGSFGGLTPTEKGGGKQTVTLEFKAPDGRKFRFRSVDKDPSATLPDELQDTAAEWVVQDQIRASYPVAPVLTDELTAAAGLLYVPHTVYVMPDDPRLGPFRQEFKGKLGILEQNPDPDAPLPPGFEGATKIIETEDLVKLLDADPSERVDERAYLKSRLFDMLVGDWDRHQAQWEWVRKPGHDTWLPFATDRDMAFADYDGLALSLARGGHPMLVVYEKDYPRILGLAWNSREVDRRLLSGLDRAAFLEAAAALQREVTDESISRSVHRLPAEYLKLDGSYFHETLRSRRAQLPAAAAKFYELLAREAEVHLTDTAEVVEVDRSERGDSIEVRVSANSGQPYFRRRFLEDDTNEVRIYAKGGADRLVSQGEGAGGIQLRFVGGPGDDTVDDSRGGRTHVFDHEGSNRIIEGPGTKESNKPYEHPKDRREYLLLDWGSLTTPMPYVSAGGGVGLLVGLQIEWLDYGFRKHPFASRHVLRGGYAFGRKGFKAEYESEYQHTNSRKRRGLFARASEVELIRFFGFGNETSGEGPRDFFRSDQRQYLLQPAFRFGLDKVDLWIGPRAKFLQTDPGVNTLLGATRPYGVGDFGQVGANLRFSADGRNREAMATRGAYFGVEGNYYPKAWDVDEAFGEAHGTASAHLSVLHLRVGGKKVWGRYPFHEAAFLGGPDTVRSLRRERYAGDAAVYGNAELRVPLFRFILLLPIRVGVLGLADVGRVYWEDESSDKWHKGYGGGLWFSVLRPRNSISITAARDPDASGADRAWRVYFNAGFAF
jgi:hypothetical protein